MAHLNRYPVSQRTRNLRPYIVALLVLFASALCVSRAYLYAAPVTFRFDATVRAVSPGSPFDLPLTYQVGDVIHGKFAFEPDSGMPMGGYAIAAGQPFALEFDINGTIVRTPSYRIELFNDTAIDDSEFPVPIDVVTLGCNEPSYIPDLISLPGGEPGSIADAIRWR